jgi:hypothetical protein
MILSKRILELAGQKFLKEDITDGTYLMVREVADIDTNKKTEYKEQTDDDFECKIIEEDGSKKEVIGTAYFSFNASSDISAAQIAYLRRHRSEEFDQDIKFDNISIQLKVVETYSDSEDYKFYELIDERQKQTMLINFIVENPDLETEIKAEKYDFLFGKSDD